MCMLENKFLDSDNKNVKFYARYVDDVVTIFEDNDHDSFFQYIKSWHKNIKFTSEVGDKMLPFLDIQLDISNNCLNTTVYHKPGTYF